MGYLENVIDDSRNDLEKNGWALVGQNLTPDAQPPTGTRKIEVESIISFGKTLRRWICYYPEKVAVNVIVWDDHRDKTVALQRKIGYELVYEFKNEPKGVFVKKIV